MAECAFCGQDRKLSDEHVFPEWLHDLVPPPDATARNWSAFGDAREDGTFEVRDRDEGPQSVQAVVKVVCETECNSGWMSRLEGDVRPILTPLIRGEARDLTPDEQRLITLWTSKTMMMAEYTDDPTRATSRAQRHYLYAHRKPPPLTTVWIGKLDGDGPPRLAYRLNSLRIRRPGGRHDPTDHATVEQTTFRLGRLVLVILSADLPWVVDLPLRFGRLDDRLHRITATGPIRWPTGPSLDEETIGVVAIAVLSLFPIRNLQSRTDRPRRP